VSTIYGRITYKNPQNPAVPGIAGVQVRLSGNSEMIVTTDANGSYRFDGLAPGFYQVVPMLAGYDFTPPLFGPADLKASSQLQIDFEGSLQISGKYVMLPIEIKVAQLSRDKILEIPVELTEPVTGDVLITFGAVAGTAGTADYAVKTTKVTIPQGSMSGVVRVTIKKAAAGEASEYFYLKIVNVTGGATIYPGRGTTMVWIIPPMKAYLPAIRKGK
jgi:hypothetical protein